MWDSVAEFLRPSAASCGQNLRVALNAPATLPEGASPAPLRACAGARVLCRGEAQPTFTGREDVHVSMVSNSAAATVTFVLHFWATGADGSAVAFKEVEHLTISAGGELEFEKPLAIC